MQDVLLLIAVVPFFIFGFYIMKKVDAFIYENEKEKYEEIKVKEPSLIIIPGDIPLIEIDQEIDRFRQKHQNFEIILKEKDISGDVS